MRNRFQQFMYGRYGADQLNRFLTTVALILIIVAMFARSSILDLVALALLAWSYARMFSKNISKRYQENAKFLQLTSKITGRFRKHASFDYRQKMYQQKAHREQKKIYRFFVCPKCSQKVRVPKGKGKIVITCPKCRNEFMKRS